MNSSPLFLHFHGLTRQLLKTPAADGNVVYPLTRRAAIKDIIEALGVPHTEVGYLETAQVEVGFDFIPAESSSVDVFPFTADCKVTEPSLLRPKPFPSLRFIVDVNALKLARNLRMAGIDTTVFSSAATDEVVATANEEGRIIVTRDRDILKRKEVIFGQLLRSEDHVQQLREVIDRYSLWDHIVPFSRCLSCNGNLEPVSKKAILHLLEPLTKKYYFEFRRCRSCAKIYWKGSHFEKMSTMLEQFVT